MSKHSSFDVTAIAYQAMASYGFNSRIPGKVRKEAQGFHDHFPEDDAHASIKDLRSLLWSSIDNPDSLDLDQVEYCTRRANGEIHVKVAVADVDSRVKKGSIIDHHASFNATSVYTGIKTFPMLPERLSHDLTSLKEGEDRLAVVIEFTVRPDGTLKPGKVYRALVHNHAKLIYETAGDWLEDKAPMPEAVSRLAGLEEQLRLQDEAAQRLREMRRRQGALELDTIEVVPIVKDGVIVDLAERERNRAHFLIENFMIASNGTMVTFLEEKGTPLIQRVVKTPERWPRIVEIAATLGETLPQKPNPLALSDFLDRRRLLDSDHFPDLSLTIIKLLGRGEYEVSYPDEEHEGHFGLAVQDYTHSTAPNRRYVDLIIQRLLKASLMRAPVPYRKSELQGIAHWCSDRDQNAKKVERFMRKVAAAFILRHRIGEVFDAIITGASEKGVYARLIAPPAEGRVVRGERGLDIGQKVKVRLTRMLPERGFIDFERVGYERTHEPKPSFKHFHKGPRRNVKRHRFH